MRTWAAMLVMGMAMGAGDCAMAAPERQADVEVEASRDQAFQAWLSELLETVRHDRNYARLPLDTDARAEEFSVVLYRLYRGEIGDPEFMEWVDARYPGHRYEQFTILKALHEHKRSLGR
ncbi:hypothetical protein [Pseudoxanthomonas putridarboris]|uniref:Uncharacterized protein n=1 Tax=Pseudoxanthomonas putridarboris TaxID=752605 RepID=A0ABU9J4U0_9GAMM